MESSRCSLRRPEEILFSLYLTSVINIKWDEKFKKLPLGGGYSAISNRVSSRGCGEQDSPLYWFPTTPDVDLSFQLCLLCRLDFPTQ